MRFVFFIALRYLFSKKSRTAINVISTIAMIGIGICAMALVVILSVFNGITSLVGSMYSSLDTDLRLVPLQGKVFSCSAEDLAWLHALPEVQSVGRTLEENALFGYREKQHLGRLLGVDSEYEQMVSLASHCREGQFLLQRGSQPLLVPALGMTYVLGAYLAQYEGITVYMPNRTAKNWLDPTTAFRKKVMGWEGVISINGDFDEQTVLAPLHFVQKLLSYDSTQVSSVAVNLKKDANLHRARTAIENHFSTRCEIQGRDAQNASLYRTMKSERLIIIIILSLILLIAMFNVVGSLSMLVIEKRTDSYVFASMGATPMQIRNIFVCEGILLAGAGGTLGILLGLVVSLLQQHFGLVSLGNATTFAVDSYPVEVHLQDLLFVFLLVLLLGYIASWFTLSKRTSNFQKS